MARTSLPGELEQVVLLALAARTGEASGGEIYDTIVDATGRDLSIAAVYITLARLEDKGWAVVRTTPPEPGKGGKPRKFFKLSASGGRALSEARAQHDALWKGAVSHPFVASDTGDEGR
jgi:DNA-binding PadR family transcriptional regulator